MAQGVIFANRQAFEGKQEAVFNYYKARNTSNEATSWSNGIDALDGSNEVLMLVDERLNDFPWSPEQVVEIDKNDTKWFPQDEI
jgi:hypothetical protein